MLYLYYLNIGDMAELVDATDLKGPITFNQILSLNREIY